MGFKTFARIGFLSAICLAALMPLFVSIVQAAPLAWHIETVDASAIVGEWSSLALDSNGYPHISYYDGNWSNLRYARWTGSNWLIQPNVDHVGDVGEYSSLALDSSDYPHISYFDRTNGALKYAEWNGTGWNIETLEYPGLDEVAGIDSSLALDSSDYPHITYIVYRPGTTSWDAILVYAKWNGTSWRLSTVDAYPDVSPDSSIDLALDSSNQPHISYIHWVSRTLKYATLNGTQWEIETVDGSGNLWFSSLGLDLSNRPHISYFDHTTDSLKHAWWNGTDWNIEIVDDSIEVGTFGTYSSLALHGSYPHISYYGSYLDDLRYAWWNGTDWKTKTVDSAGDVGQHTSIAVDSKGHTHISYYDQDNHNLKHAWDPDEYFVGTIYSPLDENGDGFDDSVEIVIDAQTTYSGTLNISVTGWLADETGERLITNGSSWEITGTLIEYGSVYLRLSEDSPVGWYDIVLYLYDERHVFEGMEVYEDAVYLYPRAGAGWIEGTVFELDTGLPLGGVVVNATDITEEYFGWTVTNASGDYRIELPAGWYNVTVKMPHFSYAWEVIFVPPGGSEGTHVFGLDRLQWELYIGVAGAGTTTPAPGSNMVEEGETVQVEAIPEEGWMLDYWVLDGEVIAPEEPFLVVVDGHHVLMAVFTEEPTVMRTLFLEASGSGTTDPELGSHIYPNGTEVFVDALPAEGWMLDYWMLDSTHEELANPFPLIMNDSYNLAAFFVEIPQSMRELTVEIEGWGTTNPELGSHYYSENETIQVTATPEENWTLDHWILDLEIQDPNNPISVFMDSHHVLRAVFVGPPPLPSIESSNQFGGVTDAFDLGDTVYVIGDEYSPSTTLDCYVVVDVESWTDGMAIPARVPGTVATVTSNIEGWIPPTIVWLATNTTGHYDIIVDVDGNGYYDEGIDSLDDSDIEVTDGFIVISEFPTFTIMLLILIMITLSTTIYKRKLLKTPIH